MGADDWAIEVYRRLAAVASERNDPELARGALQLLANAHEQSAEFDSVTATRRRVVEFSRENYGRDHVKTAIAHAQLARTLNSVGHPVQACGHYDTAVTVLANAKERHPMNQTRVRMAYAEVLIGLTKFAQAESQYLVSLAIVKEHHGDDSSALVDVLRGLTNLYESCGRDDDVRRYRKALKDAAAAGSTAALDSDSSSQ